MSTVERRSAQPARSSVPAALATLTDLDSSNVLAIAKATWTTMNDTMKKMTAMPNGPDKEKARGNMMQQQSDFDQSVITYNFHTLNALNHLWAHVDKR